MEGDTLILTLNSSNVSSQSNSILTYEFKNGGFKIPPNSKMYLNSATIPYSWFNISANIGNNSFQYIMPTSLVATNTVTVTIPDGFYTLSQIQDVLWASLKSNGYYFYNSSTTGTANPQIIYPITLTTYTPNYTNAFQFQYIPSSAPNVITQFGTGWIWALGTFPTNATTPQIVITGTVTNKTTLFGNTIGFTNQTTTASNYGAVAPTLANSQPVVVYGNSLKVFPPFPAQGSFINNVLIRCSIVDNPVATIPDIMDIIPITSAFGSNINYSNYNENYVNLKAGNYKNFQINLCDQNYNPIQILDPNMLIELIIKVGI